MVREYKKQDLDRVMELWSETNILAHSFIDSAYWTGNYDAVKAMIQSAVLYVYEENNVIQGFIGCTDDYIAGIFVSWKAQSKGIGKALLDYAKARHQVLTLDVYKENNRAVNFYFREGFLVMNEQLDEDTDAVELSMKWEVSGCSSS